MKNVKTWGNKFDNWVLESNAPKPIKYLILGFAITTVCMILLGFIIGTIYVILSIISSLPMLFIIALLLLIASYFVGWKAYEDMNEDI